MNRLWLCALALLAAPGLLKRHTAKVLAIRELREWISWVLEILKCLADLVSQ